MRAFFDRIVSFSTNIFGIIAIGFVLLSIVSFTGFPMTNDEGTWSFIGRLWTDHGLLPYRDAIEQKTPFIYYVFTLSHLLFGEQIWFPRLLAVISILISTYLIYGIGKKIHSREAGIVAAAIFVLIMPISSVDGPAVETETFLNLFRLAAMYTLVSYVGHTRFSYARFGLVGFFYGCAVACKQIALLDVIPILVFIYVLNRQNVRLFFKYGTSVIIGALVATLVSIMPLLISGGTIQEYLEGAWIILTEKGLTAASPTTRISGFLRHFFNPKLYFLSAGLIFFFSLRKKISEKSIFVLPLFVWAIVEFIEYNAQGFYLDHHYKAFIPSGSVIFGITVVTLLTILAKKMGNHSADEEKKNTKKYVGIIVLLLMLFYIPFENSYYYSFRRYLRDGNDNSARDLGILVKNMTHPGEYVYHWGIHNGPIYYYSERLAPGRYFSSYFLARPGAVEEAKEALQINTPKVILVPMESTTPDWLMNFLKQNYTLERSMYGHNIYRHL